MELFERIIGTLEYYIWNFPEPVPFVVLALLGTGIYLTFRLKFIQLRKLGHGFATTAGLYDDPDDPGDVPHFQALTTALSATVGIGNIAGVAIAIHYGGPGALFWMWVTAFLGMAVKYSEVALALHYRDVASPEQLLKKWEGTVSGGPMYYIERGIPERLGANWKKIAKRLALFFATMLMITSFLTGNGVQANTVADVMLDNFGIPVWVTGLISATIVGLVILGGITRIGAVTGFLAPFMAFIYVTGALVILFLNADHLVDAFRMIFQEAFNPTAGVAGVGAGTFLMTLIWGVRRGLFSNEAGQGSAPIAHSAAQTSEPISEAVVALLEPFIDTLVICTMTGLVIITTGVWNDRFPTELDLSSGDVTYLVETKEGFFEKVSTPDSIRIVQGKPEEGKPLFAWRDVPVEEFFVDPDMTQPFTGMLYPTRGVAVDTSGHTYHALYGMAVENGAPLTMRAFRRGLGRFGDWGHYIVIMSVILFALSTAISWSYYGDRCAKYIWGSKAILPYKAVFVTMHFLGAVFALTTVWTVGDIALGIVILPNLFALLVLSPVVVKLTRDYFTRKPWIAIYEKRKRLKEQQKKKN